jgi:hypothetical protein
VTVHSVPDPYGLINRISLLSPSSLPPSVSSTSYSLSLFYSTPYSLPLGGVDGLEDNGQRKRKCRDGLTSYKERNDAKKNKKTSEDTSSASEDESDKSNSDDEGEGEVEQGKVKKSKVSEVGDADWSENSVVKIARVMLYLVRTYRHIYSCGVNALCLCLCVSAL